MNELEAGSAPRIGATGIAALRATRPWALVVAVAAFILAVLGVINVCLYSLGGTEVPAGVSPGVRAMAAVLAPASAAVGVVINGLFGWFAWKYGRGIKSGLERPSAGGLEVVLWWQRRYWTLQGVVLIVMIAIGILGFVAAIAVGIATAAGQAG